MQQYPNETATSADDEILAELAARQVEKLLRDPSAEPAAATRAASRENRGAAPETPSPREAVPRAPASKAPRQMDARQRREAVIQRARTLGKHRIIATKSTVDRPRPRPEQPPADEALRKREALAAQKVAELVAQLAAEKKAKSTADPAAAMSDVGVDESAPSPTGADASSSGNLAEELLNQRMAAEELIESMQAQSSPARTDPPADDHPFRTEPQWEESAQAEEASSPRLAAPPLKYLTPAEAPRTAIPEARRPSRPESRTKGLIMQIAILMLTLLAIWMSVYLFFLY